MSSWPHEIKVDPKVFGSLCEPSYLCLSMDTFLLFKKKEKNGSRALADLFSLTNNMYFFNVACRTMFLDFNPSRFLFAFLCVFDAKQNDRPDCNTYQKMLADAKSCLHVKGAFLKSCVSTVENKSLQK